MLVSTLAALLVLSKSSLAANNWDEPCFQGSCTYEIPGSSVSLPGSIVISGSPTGISDISPASGWEILDCLETPSSHDIRMVCTGDELACSHLFENGAEHTIVRLPENCGNKPFARVSRAEISDNQELPSRLRSRLMRRDGTLPLIHSVSLEPRFTPASSSSPHGEVRFHILATSNPDLLVNEKMVSRRSKLTRRVFGEELQGLLELLEALSSSDDGNTLSFNDTRLYPIEFNRDINLFNSTILCGTQNINGGINLDVNPKLTGNVSMHFVAVGTLDPLHLEDFGISSLMSLDLDGSLNIAANVQGELSTGRQTLATIPLAGLAFSIPGVMTVGPVLNLDAEAETSLDINMDLGVSLGYSASNIQFAFPSSEEQNLTRVIAPKNTPLQLSVSPGVQSSAKFSAHIIPSLDIEVSAFDEAEAGVFLDFDTSASIELELDSTQSKTDTNTTQTTGINGVTGCVDAKAGFSISPGVKASVSNLFSGSLSLSIFSKNFDIFSECLPGGSTESKRARDEPPSMNLTLPSKSTNTSTSSFQCLSEGTLSPVLVIDKVVSSSSFNVD